MEPDEGTYAREQIYSLAIDLDQHLTAVPCLPLLFLILPSSLQINENLDKIIEGYNEGKNGFMNDTAQPSSSQRSGANKIIKVSPLSSSSPLILLSLSLQILKILNTHQDSLSWIDSKSKSVTSSSTFFLSHLSLSQATPKGYFDHISSLRWQLKLLISEWVSKIGSGRRDIHLGEG